MRVSPALKFLRDACGRIRSRTLRLCSPGTIQGDAGRAAFSLCDACLQSSMGAPPGWASRTVTCKVGDRKKGTTYAIVAAGTISFHTDRIGGEIDGSFPQGFPGMGRAPGRYRPARAAIEFFQTGGHDRRGRPGHGV